MEQFICTDAKLIINTTKPGKLPLEFDIKTVRMTGVGRGQTMPFETTLVNPKPEGDIKSTGTFGPLNEQNVRDTAVQGSYSFTNANLRNAKWYQRNFFIGRQVLRSAWPDRSRRRN